MMEVAQPRGAREKQRLCRNQPRLAVLIPVFNDQHGLQKALCSLAADGAEFTVYVVDDGSDPPATIPDDLPYDVRLIRQEPNQGITAALNRGLAAIVKAGYEYVARLDAGDLSLPGRFAAQVAFLDGHPEHVVVGTATRHVDVAGRVLFDYRPPAEHSRLVRGLRYRAVLVHPSIMMRLEAVQACGLYRNLFPGGEDYDLFFRLAKTYKLANLRETYLIKEINSSSITSKRRKMLLGRLKLLSWYFDFGSVHSYFGIVVNGFLLLLPRGLVFGLRRWWDRRS
jgi:glycosyltransferase involved in cell wall biosynthesis